MHGWKRDATNPWHSHSGSAVQRSWIKTQGTKQQTILTDARAQTSSGTLQVQTATLSGAAGSVCSPSPVQEQHVFQPPTGPVIDQWGSPAFFAAVSSNAQRNTSCPQASVIALHHDGTNTSPKQIQVTQFAGSQLAWVGEAHGYVDRRAQAAVIIPA